MSEATLTSKCQIAIPAEIRHLMRLAPGQKVVFTQLQDGTALIRAKTRSIQDLKGLLKPKPGKSGERGGKGKIAIKAMQISRS
jgi:antitoxin PrlF